VTQTGVGGLLGWRCSECSFDVSCVWYLYNWSFQRLPLLRTVPDTGASSRTIYLPTLPAALPHKHSIDREALNIDMSQSIVPICSAGCV
jgi:hypothetical protein